MRRRSLQICLILTLLGDVWETAVSAASPGQEAGGQETPSALSPVDPIARAFEVTYVTADGVYVDGGSESGLEEGTRLTVRRRLPGAALGEGEPIGEIVVFAVTRSSAVCEIGTATGIMVGDIAYMSTEDRVRLEELESEQAEAGYVQVVSFTSEDPLSREIRENQPRPPLPEVNRLRGRIGFEHGSLSNRNITGGNTRQEGLYLRADMTRIGGSYWSLTGYWRGRINSHSTDPQSETLTDLTNRVYHIGLYYNNPNRRFVAGVGRLLLPWANSLSTVDGGYIGSRFGSSTTVGAFGGSTPDPTAWNYAPDRMIVGGFVNVDKGSFESTHYTGTAGVALTRVSSDPERHFMFLENTLQFGQHAAVYHNVEIDYNSRDRFASATDGPALTRSFTTLRLRPHALVTLDLSHNHFRLLPSFDPRLTGSGLVDDLLFEGLSGGIRAQPAEGLTLYTRLGRSRRDEDPMRSLNQMYGVTISRLPWGLRSDVRYSLFDGPFGSGTYRSASLIHSNEVLRLEVQGGDQRFESGLNPRATARYVNVNLDWFLGRNLIWGAGTSIYRGNQQSYDQFFLSLGYSFQSIRRQADED